MQAHEWNTNNTAGPEENRVFSKTAHARGFENRQERRARERAEAQEKRAQVKAAKERMVRDFEKEMKKALGNAPGKGMSRTSRRGKKK